MSKGRSSKLERRFTTSGFPICESNLEPIVNDRTMRAESYPSRAFFDSTIGKLHTLGESVAQGDGAGRFTTLRLICLEIRERGGFGFERGDGFDEASDGEGVADAARAADQPEHAAIARQLDGDAHERGDAGAVDLRDAVQHDDDLAGAILDDRIESIVELIGGLADGEPAVDFENRHTTGLADVDLHGRMVSHGSESVLLPRDEAAVRPTARHYTLERGLHKGDLLRAGN